MPDSSDYLPADPGYQQLLGRISTVYATGQVRAHQAVNAHITETYWQIGHDIVEFEQGGNIRAEYGKQLVARLAKDLTVRHGKGFSRSNVMMMKAFYLAFPKVQTLSGQLSWSHYVELLSIDDTLERGHIFNEGRFLDHWDIPESEVLAVIDPYIALARLGTWAAIKLAAVGYPTPPGDPPPVSPSSYPDTPL